MARPSKSERTWSDAQLTAAVADSSNWRDVNQASTGQDDDVLQQGRVDRVAILLHTYTNYIAGGAAGLMAPSAAAA
jgi:hypothetical protein